LRLGLGRTRVPRPTHDPHLGVEDDDTGQATWLAGPVPEEVASGSGGLTVAGQHRNHTGFAAAVPPDPTLTSADAARCGSGV